MTLEQFIGFSVFAFVACVTPGPNNMLLTAVGGSRGIRRGLPTLMGVAFGFALMLFLVAIGVGRTVLALEHFSGTVRWVGAAFLIWLAWNIASAPVANAGASDNAVPRTARRHRTRRQATTFAVILWLAFGSFVRRVATPAMNPLVMACLNCSRERNRRRIEHRA